MMDEEKDAFASEYVLGTLDADERAQAEALVLFEPAFAEAVRRWERRLGELNVLVTAVEPPTAVWDRIKAQLPNVPPSEAIRLPAIELPKPPETVCPFFSLLAVARTPSYSRSSWSDLATSEPKLASTRTMARL